MNKIWKHGPLALAVILLIGVGVESAMNRQAGESPAPYHARVREAVKNLSYQVGDWVGTDIDVPAVAVAMLDPNAIVSRQFANVRTGHEVIFLFVQCGDARDLLGHYPPVCYPARGWHLLGSNPGDWRVDDRTIHGTTYEFTRETIGNSIPIIIDNFMILPSGETVRSMEQVNRTAQNRTHKWFGAAQIQVIFSGEMPVDQRRRVFEEILHAHMKLVTTVADGVDSKP